MESAASVRLTSRAIVCAIAIGLLWATSLAAARHLAASAADPPPFHAVRTECTRAHLHAERLREANRA